MFPRASLLALALAAVASAQQIGTNTAETHPKITASQCTTAGGCVSAQHSIVLDANWRWLHSTSSLTNCYSGNTWDTALCPDATTCAKNCALDGADYSGTYGVSTSGNAATLNFVTPNSNGQNVGSRLYLMDTSDAKYQGFNLINQEFTLDIDMSKLGCGLNGAVYFSEMALDGGMSTQPNNAAGAKYGTGYCDSQCPRDLKFIGGLANEAGWNSTTANSGKGNFGSCCSEMDIWEANQFAEAVTPHPCSSIGLARTDCTANGGAACANGGVCDAAGCDFNSWRMGNQTFLGPGSGFTIDTTKPITAITQFISSDGTANGDLVEIRRKFVQNGIEYDNSYSNIPGLTPYNSLTDANCAAQKTAFGDTNTFAQEGGLKVMGEAFKRGMVLVLSIWDDTAVSMNWLDSDYPPTASVTAPGVNRGPCSTTAGLPATVEKNQASDSVIYSNIRWGDIGSTTSGVTTAPGGGGGTTTTSKPVTSKPVTTTTTTTTSTPAKPTGCTSSKYGQCGGQGWTGCTTCASGSTCKVSNQWYSQCL